MRQAGGSFVKRWAPYTAGIELPCAADIHTQGSQWHPIPAMGQEIRGIAVCCMSSTSSFGHIHHFPLSVS